jgi:hypothetical protein
VISGLVFTLFFGGIAATIIAWSAARGSSDPIKKANAKVIAIVLTVIMGSVGLFVVASFVAVYVALSQMGSK